MTNDCRKCKRHHRSVLRCFPVFWTLFPILGMAQAPSQGSLHSASKVYQVRVQSASTVEDVVPWNILFATGEIRSTTPAEGLRDFANQRESTLLHIVSKSDLVFDATTDPQFSEARTTPGRMRYWGAVVPATLSLTYREPFILEQVGLKAAARNLGFSDFSLLVRGSTSEAFHQPHILEATAGLGRSLHDGFQWMLRLAPEEVREAAIRFERGGLEHPDRVYLRDVDFWGRPSGNP